MHRTRRCWFRHSASGGPHEFLAERALAIEQAIVRGWPALEARAISIYQRFGFHVADRYHVRELTS